MSLTRDYETVLRQLDRIHAAKPRKGHPLWIGLMEGKLSRSQVAIFLKQFSAIPLYNHNYHGPLYVNCPSPQWRARMAEVVYEEGAGKLFAGGVPHHELYLRMGEAFGISRQEMYDTEFCAGALAVRHYFENICRKSFLEGIAAISLGSEAQVPGVAGRVSDAFVKHYGLTREQAAFYSVHEEADKDHSNLGLEILRDFAHSDADIDLVIRAVRDAVEVSWGMFEDIWHMVQEKR
jgi:pyrroloquinoline quinone (PQQ) biosynthesis protein C